MISATVTGPMCPSFCATREEKHSTRGRANLLRHLLTDPAALLAPERKANTGEVSDVPVVNADMVYDALSLCLSCKACESECPSSVDMAKLKSDFMAKYYALRGLPIRAFLFGHIARFNALGAPFAPLANWAFGLGVTRWLLSKIGITPHRAMPMFAARTFSAWWKGHIKALNQQLPDFDPRNTVALFVDTFTNYNHQSMFRKSSFFSKIICFFYTGN